MSNEMKRIEPQMSVRHRSTGRVGVTCPDFMSCCADDETPVVFDGAAAFCGTLTDELEVIGLEQAVAEPGKCGAGPGSDCCLFLVVGRKGFECERFGSLRFTLQFKKKSMSARREPVRLFPLCQLTAEKGCQVP